MNHPTVACVSLSALSHNMRLLQQAAGPVPLWPAVKANAYGHGALLVTRHLVSLGFTTVCVAHLREALELIEAGAGAKKILVFAGLQSLEAADAVRHAEVVEPVVSSAQMLRALSAAVQAAGKEDIGIHLQVDTGMTRQGCAVDEFAALVDEAKSTPGIRVVGTMSHFPRADDLDDTFTRQQIELFDRQPYLGMRHLCNSAGTLRFPAAHYQACRPGIAVYGLQPGPGVDTELSRQLRPVMRLESRISLVKPGIPKGTGVSYGHSYVTERDSTTLAVVPIGYGDGYQRLHSNRAHASVKGKRCRVVGRVTMDQAVLDVTDVENVKENDTVELIGKLVTADELAKGVDTINYEITTALTSRVVRKTVE